MNTLSHKTTLSLHDGITLTVLSMLLLFFHVLMVIKFWPLFSTWDDTSWTLFMRNYHMSGYDPMTLLTVTDGSVAYDIIRHPLLPVVVWPLFLVNKLLWWLTGMNCGMILVSATWWLMSVLTVWLLWRTLVTMGTRHGVAWLIVAWYYGLGHVLTGSIVADHFAISHLLLVALLHRCAQTFSGLRAAPRLGEWCMWTAIVSGVTLSNGAMVVVAALLVTGWRREAWLTVAVTCGVVVALACCGLSVDALLRTDTGRVMQWATEGRAPFWPTVVENFFGESLQLHRDHILGDVLVRRPVIVTYRWWWQYVAEAVMALLLIGGAWWGRRRREVHLTMMWLAFNMTLHLVIGFGMNEVYIMTMHWAVVLPVTTSALAACHSHGRVATMAVVVALIPLTIYLWSYHGWLLWRYLTWPLTDS